MTSKGRGEAGDTLIELLVTVAIMGLAIVFIVGGIAQAAMLSGLHRDQADVSAALASAAEYVKSLPYQPCGVGADPTPALEADVTSWWSDLDAAQADVAAPAVTAATSLDGTACSSANLTADPGIELITVKDSSADGRVTQVLYLAKGDR